MARKPARPPVELLISGFSSSLLVRLTSSSSSSSSSSYPGAVLDIPSRPVLFAAIFLPLLLLLARILSLKCSFTRRRNSSFSSEIPRPLSRWTRRTRAHLMRWKVFYFSAPEFCCMNLRKERWVILPYKGAYLSELDENSTFFYRCQFDCTTPVSWDVLFHWKQFYYSSQIYYPTKNVMEKSLIVSHRRESRWLGWKSLSSISSEPSQNISFARLNINQSDSIILRFHWDE